MTTRTSTKLALTFILAASVLAFFVFSTAATTLTWTGLSTVTNDWSDTNNWSPAQLLAPADSAVFGNGGSTNVIGVVTSTVNTNLTLTTLTCSALASNLALATNYHTILINTGVTLTVKSPNSTFTYVGTGADDGLGASNYTTIVGAGHLILGDPASPSTNANSNLQVKQASVASGLHRAILDMSGLDKFTFAAGKFVVAGDGTFGGAGDRPQGSVLLAKTNVITCAAPRVTDPSAVVSQPFTIGYSQGSQSATTTSNHVQLGQENTINADYIKIGGLKLVGLMSFRAGLINPTLKLRGRDGVSRVPQLVCGDHGEARTSGFVVRGNLDLRGGTVDALVDEMWLAKTGWRDAPGVDTGAAIGVMSFSAGTFDVTTLNIGAQQGNTGITAANGSATGTANVLTNASMIVGTINIGRDGGSGAGTGIGTLNINAGLVTVSGNIIENDAPGADGTSVIVLTNNGTLNMMPLGDTVPGNITVDRLNIGSATLTNYGTLGLTTLNCVAPATNFTVYSGQALAPSAPGVVGTLTVNGSLTLNGGKLRLDLNSPGVNDLIVVTNILTLAGASTVEASAASGTITPGTYTVMTYGTLIGDTNNLQVTGALANSRYNFEFDTNTVPNVNLTVSGGPTAALTWSGDGLANVWDLHTITNWNSHTEKFYDLDTVTFDDTGATSPAVNLVGTLEPAGSVTVNSTSNYTFGGSGKISGSCGLTKDGIGTLTLFTTNDFTGDTTINAGTVLVNGAFGNTAVTVNSGATFGGAGTILGPVTVQAGGIFTPGASIGTFAISNNLVLNDGTTNVFEANLNTLTYDKVIGLNKVTYGGTLSLVLSGRPVVVTDTFKLFSATTLPTAFSSPYAGTFTSIIPATPGPANLLWNTSTLTTDGTLRVVSTTSTSMSVEVTGNQVDISWPADHIGWKLQRQINPITVGLSNNWVDVAGSTTTNHVTVTLNPANETVFYRLVSPDLP